MHNTSRKRRSLGLLAAIAMVCSCGLSNRLYAIAPIGDDSELFITGTAAATYNDNIFLSNSDATDALFFDFIPGLSYEFGKTGSLMTGQLAASEDLEVFTSHSRLNNDMFNGVFWSKYEDANSSLDLDASMHQADAAERGIQNLDYLVKRDLYHVDGIGEVDLTEKSSLGAGVIWDDTNYEAVGFTNWRYWQIPINYYWKVEPKLDVSAGFQYQDNSLGFGGVDSSEEYYNVGARGEFTPNLTGKFTVGYLRENLNTTGISAKGGLGVESEFTYTITPLTTLTFGVNDDYGYAATGDNYRDLSAYVGAQTTFAPQWTALAQLAYNHYSYTTFYQRDDFYTAKLGIGYAVNTNISLQANYTYADDTSNVAAFTFKNNILSVSATFHY